MTHGYHFKNKYVYKFKEKFGKIPRFDPPPKLRRLYVKKHQRNNFSTFSTFTDVVPTLTVLIN